MMTLKQTRQKIDAMKVLRKDAELRLLEAEQSKDHCTQRQEWLDKAQAIIHEASLMTQEQLSFRLASIATFAQEAVYDSPYTVQIGFDVKRGRTEVDIWFETPEGNCTSPTYGTGIGPVDLASFALRLSMWNIQKSRSLIWMDEPFKHVQKDKFDKVGTLLQELAKDLGLQFVIVTHEPSMSAGADHVWQVTKKDGVSQVRRVGEPLPKTIGRSMRRTVRRV